MVAAGVWLNVVGFFATGKAESSVVVGPDSFKYLIEAGFDEHCILLSAECRAADSYAAMGILSTGRFWAGVPVSPAPPSSSP